MSEARWWIAKKELENGWVLHVIPLTFGRARVTITKDMDSHSFDDVW